MHEWRPASHFDGKRFVNPGAPQARGLWDALRWQLTARRDRSPKWIDDVTPCTAQRIEGSQLRCTLVNHSTVLIQQQGLNILTDPIWSERASPLAWVGPRRRRDPGIRSDDLPRIDLVLLSHNHYDHLDLPTLRWLARQNASVFVVPKGVARLLASENIGPVHELDWGDTRTVAGAGIQCVPAFHFSGRGLFDRNRSLWCGYVIETNGRIVYFAGDTAFGGHFAEIRERFGPPHLALLPIGAYEPRWFMSRVHMAPEEAIRAHQILGSSASVATHHGTFQLADDGIDTARNMLKDNPDKPEAFVILGNGQSVEIA